MGQEDDDSYEFLGRGETRGANTHYRTLRIRRRKSSGNDAEEPIYKVGDVVAVNGSTGRWVAHCVAFFDVRPPTAEDDDSDIDVVADSQAENFLKVDLRWFYRFRELEVCCRRRCAAPLPGELYLSDKIETHSVGTILGHATVAATEKELAKTKSTGKDNAAADAHLCRYLYGNQPLTPPSIRQLNTGELAALLRNPSHDELYRAGRPIRGCLGPVAKGVNSKRYSPTSGISTKDKHKHALADPEKLTKQKIIVGDEDAQIDPAVEIPNKATSSSLSVTVSNAGDEDEEVAMQTERTDTASKQVPKTSPSKYNLRSNVTGPCGKRRKESMESVREPAKTRPSTRESVVENDDNDSAHVDGKGGPCSRKSPRKTLKRPVKLCDRATQRAPVAINRMRRSKHTGKVARKSVPKTARKSARTIVSTSFAPPPKPAPNGNSCDSETKRTRRKVGRRKITCCSDEDDIDNDIRDVGKMQIRGSFTKATTVTPLIAPQECAAKLSAPIAQPECIGEEEADIMQAEMSDVDKERIGRKAPRRRIACSSHEDDVVGDSESTANTAATEEREDDAFREVMEVWAGMSDAERIYHSEHLEDIVSAMFAALDKTEVKDGNDDWCDEMADESIRIYNSARL